MCLYDFFFLPPKEKKGELYASVIHVSARKNLSDP